MQNNFYVSSFGTRYHSIGRTGLAIEASYWTPSLMSQFNLAGGVGGCSTSLHYGMIVTFGFISKSPFRFRYTKKSNDIALCSYF